MTEAAGHHLGRAWVGLCLALAVHVADEAANDFLSFWNPLAESARQRLPFLPLPTFTFGVWLGALVFAVLALLALSGYASRGKWWMVGFSYVFGIAMLINGLQHIAVAAYFRTPIAGVYSSPVLLLASGYLLRCAHRVRRSTQLDVA